MSQHLLQEDVWGVSYWHVSCVQTGYGLYPSSLGEGRVRGQKSWQVGLAKRNPTIPVQTEDEIPSFDKLRQVLSSE